MKSLFEKYPLQIEAFENGELRVTTGYENWNRIYLGGINIFILDCDPKDEGYEEITVTVHNAVLSSGETVLVTMTYPELDVYSAQDVIEPRGDEDVHESMARVVNNMLEGLFTEITYGDEPIPMKEATSIGGVAFK